MEITSKGIIFDRGIDRVITQTDTPQGHLPADGRLAPSDGRVMPRLDQLLAAPNIGNRLAAELAPRMEDRDMLLPDQFHGALNAVQDRLGKEVRNHPENKAAFREAQGVLKEESDLRDLVDMYRSALFKG